MAKRRFKIGISFLALVCIFLSWGSFSVFADNLSIKKNGNCRIFDSLPFGPSNCVAVEGNIVFAACGGVILIYDVSNISAPVKISEIRTSGVIMKMIITGDIMYAAAESDGMYIFDIKDQASPKILKHLATGVCCSDVCLSGDFLFLGLQGNLKIFKVNNSNPADILLVQEITIRGQVENILFEKDKLFVACGSAGLYIFDLRDNSKCLKHICLSDNAAYALADFQGYIYFNLGGSIYALDTKSFVYKKLASLPSRRGNIYYILIKGDLLFAYSDEQIYCFQIKRPLSFRYRGKKSTPGDHTRQGVMYKNFMFASAEDAGVMIYDLSNPNRLILKSEIEGFGSITGAVVDKDKLFVSDYKGLTIYDISDSMKLEASNKVFKPYPGIIKARIFQNHILILRESPNYGPRYVDILEIPDFRKIKSIKFPRESEDEEIKSRRFPGDNFNIKIKNNKLFAIDDHHFYAYDISLIRSPKLEYSVSLPGFLRNMNICKKTLFITVHGSQDANPDMFAFELDDNGSVINKLSVSCIKKNPLGEHVKGILDADYFDKLLEYDKYIYITRQRNLYVFLKHNDGLELLHSLLLPDSVRDLSLKQEQNAIYLYLALEKTGLYVVKHNMDL